MCYNRTNMVFVMYCTLGIFIIIFMLMTSLIISVLESISVFVLYSVIITIRYSICVD